MRSSLLILTSILLLLSSTVMAEDIEINTRSARHMLVPFIGYQTMDGETVGFSFETQTVDFIEEEIITVSRSGESERNITTPELGIAYRYMPLDILFAELTLSATHDKVDLEYPVYYEAATYTQRTKAYVSRSNTVMTNLSFIFNIPVKVKWIKPSLRLGGGYAWREIDVKGNFNSEIVSSFDADGMYVVRGGVDVSLWRENNFMIEGSMYYTSYIPTGEGVDPFGGLGWRISVFPVWSVKQR